MRFYSIVCAAISDFVPAAVKLCRYTIVDGCAAPVFGESGKTGRDNTSSNHNDTHFYLKSGPEIMVNHDFWTILVFLFNFRFVNR